MASESAVLNKLPSKGWPLPLLALFGLGAMSDLSPECAPKRTSARATPGLFKEVQLNQGRPRAMASVRTTDIGFPLVSFSESSGLSICSHPSGRTGLFPSLFSVSGPFSGGMSIASIQRGFPHQRARHDHVFPRPYRNRRRHVNWGIRLCRLHTIGRLSGGLFNRNKVLAVSTLSGLIEFRSGLF